MQRVLYTVFFLLLAALYVYFLGTPMVSNLTGLALRTVSLAAGFAVVVLGLVSFMLGRLAARHGAPERPDIDSRP
jgi:hypothetical protein